MSGTSACWRPGSPSPPNCRSRPPCSASSNWPPSSPTPATGRSACWGGTAVITEFITTGVSDSERAAIGHIPVGRGILGVLIDDARPLRLHDIADDPRSVGFPANHPPMRSFLGAPVTARGQVYGNLYLTEKQRRRGLRRRRRAGPGPAGHPGRGGDRERPAVRGGPGSRPAAGGGPGHHHGDPGRHRQRRDAQPRRWPRQGAGRRRPGHPRPPGRDRPAGDRSRRRAPLRGAAEGEPSRLRGRSPARCSAPARRWRWPTPRPTTGSPSRSSAPGSGRRCSSLWPCAATPWAR